MQIFQKSAILLCCATDIWLNSSDFYQLVLEIKWKRVWCRFHCRLMFFFYMCTIRNASSFRCHIELITLTLVANGCGYLLLLVSTAVIIWTWIPSNRNLDRSSVIKQITITYFIITQKISRAYLWSVIVFD